VTVEPIQIIDPDARPAINFLCFETARKYSAHITSAAAIPKNTEIIAFVMKRIVMIQ
jgi:hypothetical protein